jgi:hypothetical protein
MSKKLTKFQEQCLERQARRRAAWGQYISFIRQQRLAEEEKKDPKRRRSSMVYIG